MNSLLLTLTLLHGLDACSTTAVMAQGGRELNPILSQSIARNVAMQSVITTAQVLALHHMHEKHPKWARTLAVIAIGLEGAIVVHNVKNLR